MEIAANPLKAYDYGQVVSATYKRNKNTKDFMDAYGYKKVSQCWVMPSAFFYSIAFNEIQNISEDGVTTYINLGFPAYVKTNYIEEFDKFYEDLKKNVEAGSVDVNENGDTTRYISATKQMATVWGYQGNRNTLYWESENQICITDNYYVRTSPGICLFCFCNLYEHWLLASQHSNVITNRYLFDY